jgi:hypothetical protein
VNDDLCGERWHGGNAAVTCQRKAHDKDTWHRALITKAERIEYPTAVVTSDVTDTVEWEDSTVALARALDRSKKAARD